MTAPVPVPTLPPPAGPAGPGPTDAELLKRYAAGRDAAAFACLVARHGAAVWQVCRSRLPFADAQDAAQDTFLALLRQAAAIRTAEALGAWLARVARRRAARARAAAERRRRHERASQTRAAWGGTAGDDASRREVGRVVAEEVSRLPEPYRAPLVLCCLLCRSRTDAATELGWTPTELKGRLERARRLLRRRLSRRGFGPTAAA
jgi:RNA polymerase sigma factor (sigma-70 family)